MLRQNLFLRYLGGQRFYKHFLGYCDGSRTGVAMLSGTYISGLPDIVHPSPSTSSSPLFLVFAETPPVSPLVPAPVRAPENADKDFSIRGMPNN